MTGNMAKSHMKAVTINEGGDMFLDAYPVSAEELGQRLAELKAANPSQAMVIKGDAHTQYLKVMQVLEAMKRADITDVGLVTARATE
jgi:biopolymer transport protein ExbD